MFIKKVIFLFALLLGGVSTLSFAQSDSHQHTRGGMNGSMDSGSMAGHDMPEMSGSHPNKRHDRTGMLGSYAMSREASGTSWQPESSPESGVHFTRGEWMGMFHGSAALVYDDQGSDRGNEQLFSPNMLMVMAHRPVGQATWGLRGMFSLEPATIGKKGYPLLFQTGETANGTDPLIDRQHPHDLFMELSTTYSVPVGEEASIFGYLGYPGEPALGPPAFMHRFSSMENPEAPLTHHWLDSTHITYGVATGGYAWRNLKLEGSIFTGREPDENRWDLDKPEFDSYSTRLTYNFSSDWSAQASYGWLNSPEILEPERDQDRFTASVTYNRAWDQNNWQTTFAYGRNMNDPGSQTDGFLLESALNVAKTHTFFGRYENVEKDELFQESDPLHGKIFTINKVSTGYIYDFPEWKSMRWGVGGLFSVHFVPAVVEDAYGEKTPTSFMLFARVKV